MSMTAFPDRDTRLRDSRFASDASISFNRGSHLEEEIRPEVRFEGIVGYSPALREALQPVEMVAPNDSTVLLRGETGTGRELIARAIHHRSRRRNRTLVKPNCAAIHERPRFAQRHRETGNRAGRRLIMVRCRLHMSKV